MAEPQDSQIALKIPNGTERLRPGVAFAPLVDAGPADDTATIDRIVALLGRSPSWPNQRAVRAVEDAS